MNKNLLFWTFIFGVLSLYACTKDNKQPIIYVKGDSVLEIRYDTIFQDPGAIAKDAKNRDISEKIVSDWDTQVNLKKLGEYTVTYSDIDKKKNEAKVTRKVIVKLKASNLLGQYNSKYTLNGYPDSDNFIASIKTGEKENEFFIQPVGHPHLTVKMALTGILGTEIGFSYAIGDYFIEGAGTIENNGKNINFNYRNTYQGSHTSTGTQTLSKL